MTTLPSNLHYSNKLESAYARSYTTHIQSQSPGDYTDGQTIIINIPTAANLTMASSESVLKFDLQIANIDATNNFIRLDKAGAHGVIQRLRVYHGSALLEDLDNYGNIVAQLTALQKSSACIGKDSILQGFTTDQFCDVQDATGTATKSNRVTPIIAGERLISAAADNTSQFTQFPNNGVSKKRTYCINLLSILGSLSEKYVPLFAMSGSPIRLEIQLASNPNKFACAEKEMAGFVVSNCEYIASLMELSDQAMQIINASASQPLQWVVPSYRNYMFNSTINTGTFQATVPVPAKFNSLKSMFMTIRSKGGGDVKHFPFASTHFNLGEYSIRLGSRVIPSKAPQNTTEFFVELLKSIGSVSDMNHETMINYKNYNSIVPAQNTESTVSIKASTTCATFMIGVDLETYSNSDKTHLFAGYNSSNEDIFFQLIFQGCPNVTAVRFDTYALYDAVIICENGMASTRY